MMSDATALKRKRARLACEPCRERKRKCNGESPCSTCTSWGYECHYQAPRRVRSKPADRGTNVRDQNEPILESSPRQVGRFTETLEVNSGAAFVRKIGLKVDPANAPKLNLFGWNVGRRKSPAGLPPVAAFPIVEILSLMQMRTLANVYFAKVDPCYGFIDSSDFFRCMDNRWQPNAVESTYDGVLAGVAALGCLFSGTNINITESHLVELARSISETHVGSVRPSLHLVTVWTLRVIYLRMTAPPYPAWVASSTLMHLIEASRLNQLTADDDRDLDTRRRLIGVAQHLNLWISYDLGLSRVPLGSDALGLPLSRPGDFTTELLGLLPVTASLGPETQRPDQEIEELLHQTLNRTHTKPPSLLCQCNLVLCLLRRLRLTNLTASPTTMTKVLDLLKRSLCAAREMVADCSPWHHVPNVPFQMISIILEMDTSPALELLPEAMQTLRVVASTYDTETMREAYNTACLLILLYERRRRADTRLLSTVLQEYQQSPATESSLQQMATSDEVSWLEGLVADVPTLQGLDFSQFLQPDMLRMSPDASAWGNKSG